MINNTDLLSAYLEKLGLNPKFADIYKTLQARGPQTISELARNSGVERIQIYRLLDELKASGLVEVEVRYKRSILHAAPIATLQVLLSKQEQKLKDLQNDYHALASAFAGHELTSTGTRIQFYEGMDGIKQMLWNQTKGKGENLSILYDNMQHKTNLAFFERWVRTCNERGLRFRGIIGDHFVDTQQQWYAKHANERLVHWESRYVSDKTFPIPHSIVVYDDVVLHYNWNDERIFGMEIHDPTVAQVQRQFFNMLWGKAETVDDLVGVPKTKGSKELPPQS